MPNFRKLQDDSKNVSLKIGSKVPQKLGPFFSLFLMRKTLSSGQKWFLRPYFPLIRGMFLLRSGLRFLFGHWKWPNLEWGKGHTIKWKWPFHHSRFGHFQYPKQISKTTSQQKHTPKVDRLAGKTYLVQKKKLKTAFFCGIIWASPHFGTIWRPNCWHQVNH